MMFTGAFYGPIGNLPKTRMTWDEAVTKLKAEIAARKGKAPNELVPWVDYDPIWLDEEAYHMSRGHTGVRWAGD